MFRTGLAWSDSAFRRQAIRHWGAAASALAVAAVVGSLAVPPSALARATRPQDVVASDSAVALSELPVEARRTHRLILTGGPFPYAKDGVTFFNRERQLPPRARGHYREYTVATPDSHDRGARRIVCGGQRPAQPDVCFYTDNHYASFRRIVAP